MKRIAVFHPVDDKYGASKILAYAISVLTEKYKCDIYLPNDKGFLKEMISDNPNVRYFEMPELPVVHRGMYNVKGLMKWMSMNIKTFLFLKKKKKEYDLVYINTLALFSITLISKILGIKNLLHCHEYLNGSLYGRFIKFVVQHNATFIISVSRHVASYISANRPHGYVVHNGIPDIEVHQSERLNNGFVNFAMVGRVMPEKGQWFLLDAMQKLPAETVNKMKVHVYGDAPPTRIGLMSKFKEDIKSFKLEDNIIIHGFDAAASNKILELDCCLVPSLMPDPFPTTVLEAMRAAKIVISTNHGGANEVIKNGINGFSINKSDSVQFAQILEQVIDMTPSQREMIGHNARQTYLNDFTLECFGKRFITIIDKYL